MSYDETPVQDATKPKKRKGITFIRKIRTGRNEPCICGSGKKFKRCCLDKTKKIYVKADYN
jgi:uncharacterized protein YecA (UPF0149 family)